MAKWVDGEVVSILTGSLFRYTPLSETCGYTAAVEALGYRFPLGEYQQSYYITLSNEMQVYFRIDKTVIVCYNVVKDAMPTALFELLTFSSLKSL